MTRINLEVTCIRYFMSSLAITRESRQPTIGEKFHIEEWTNVMKYEKDDDPLKIEEILESVKNKMKKYIQ